MTVKMVLKLLDFLFLMTLEWILLWLVGTHVNVDARQREDLLRRTRCGRVAVELAGSAIELKR